jgi:sulfur carrier protein
MIKIKVNGKSLDIEKSLTLSSFLTEKKLSAGSVIIEYNGSVIDRSSFNDVTISEGDVIEIIRAFAGG